MNSEHLINDILRSPVLRTAIEGCIRQRTQGENSHRESVQENSVAGTSCSNPVVSVVNTSVREELRRLFPSSRPNNNSTGVPVRNKRKKYKEKQQKFNCDVILLKSWLEKRTLIGKKKAKAYEEGYAVSSVEFEKIWSVEEVRNKFKACFTPRLEETAFEIMVPVGGYLVRPTLSENQVLDGFYLHKLFHTKTIYLRPLETLVTKEENFCEDNLDCAGILEESSLSFNITNAAINDNSLEHSLMEQSTINIDVYKKICEEPTSLNDILSKLRSQINEDTCTYFNIFRDDIFQCCVRALNRKSFCPYNKLSVCFTDCDDNTEGAIDAGGPTREMFRLLLQFIKKSYIFTGPEKGKYIVFNKDALEKEEYLNIGKLIVLSIVHAGLCPSFFSNLLFQQIIDSDFKLLTPNLHDIFDEEIKEEIEAAIKCCSLNELRTVVIEGTYIRLAGWRMINDFEKKETMIKDVVAFYAVERNEKCITQLRDGLKIMDFYTFLKKYPEYFIETFCESKTQILDVHKFESLFETNLSEIGSNRRRTENKIIAFWKDYLIECFESNAEECDCCTLEEILSFCTGSDSVPLFGFPRPLCLDFLHEDASPFPKGNTCGLILHLPTVHSNFDEFKSKVTFGFKNGMVFGFT